MNERIDNLDLIFENIKYLMLSPFAVKLSNEQCNALSKRFESNYTYGRIIDSNKIFDEYMDNKLEVDLFKVNIYEDVVFSEFLVYANNHLVFRAVGNDYSDAKVVYFKDTCDWQSDLNIFKILIETLAEEMSA